MQSIGIDVTDTAESIDHDDRGKEVYDETASIEVSPVFHCEKLSFCVYLCSVRSWRGARTVLFRRLSKSR